MVNEVENNWIALKERSLASHDESHLKQIAEMERRFRKVESLFALTYSQLINLENKVASHNEMW